MIRQIAHLVSGNMTLPNAETLISWGDILYELTFDAEGIPYIYSLEYGDLGIVQEILIEGDSERLNRKGEKLYYNKLGEELDFKIDNNVVAVTKGDSIQQPFFDKVTGWGQNISHYEFGGQMNNENISEGLLSGSIPFRENGNVSIIYEDGTKHNSNFDKIILEDMYAIGYEIESIKPNTIANRAFLTIKEKDSKSVIWQYDLSQGMFRALSLIIQLNYSLLSNKPSLILIDDIGEGLDYERSKKLIDLIIKKVEGTQVQLIMTTNDRFVMNKVPLKYWQVIKREGNKSVFYNYENSKQTFDDFALTGLSNFDFFATEFFVKGFDEYVKVNP